MTAARLWLPVVAYMAAIFYASSQSSLPSATAGVPDTVLHTVGYGGLALCTLRAFAGGRMEGVTGAALVAAWMVTTVYGATDEWHQTFTPGRTAEWRDLANDAIGAFVALGLVGAWGIMRRASRAR